MEFSHKPVLLTETIEGLNIRPGGIYIDCTTGGGGHSIEIAKKLVRRAENNECSASDKKGTLICFDQDKEAIEAAKKRFSEFLPDFHPIFVNRNFVTIKETMEELNLSSADGILMDLGVSSYQLDNRERGFSYHDDAPLDMRMSGEGMTAADVVNEYTPERLTEILYKYGEEKYAAGIVKGIVSERAKAPILTTGQLAEIIKSNVPAKVRRDKNPCRKTFQAIRIEVNQELTVLETALEDGFRLLSPGGRMAVITFHSLEDRMVKNAFKDKCTGCICPPEFPVCVCGRKPQGILVNKKPITAGDEELADNSRSRSAKLRVIEKLPQEKT